MENPVYLVIGAQGFIGTWIIQRLQARKASIVGFDLKPDTTIFDQVLDDPRSVRMIYGDISDFKKVQQVLNEVKPTYIIHLAALQIPACAANPRLGAVVNVIGTINLFEASAELRKKYPGTVKTIVYASSAAVAGPPSDYKDGVVDDDENHKPLTHYGAFKITNEGTARLYWDSDQIPSIAIRPLTVYGVGREIGLTSAPTKAIKAAILGLPYTVGFTGTTNFNYVEDVADLFLQCCSVVKEGAHRAFIKGSAHSIQEFVNTIHKQLPESKDKVKLLSTSRTIPFPSAYTAKTLDSLIGEKHLITTPLDKGIEKIILRFRELHRKGVLHTRDLVDPVAPAVQTPIVPKPTSASEESWLITGSQGFIACWIIKKLLEEGKSKIVGTDLKEDTLVPPQVLGSDAKKVPLLLSDITDYKHVLEIFEKVRPTHVIHLAALQIPACKANPRLGAAVNVLGTVNVFEAAKALKDKYGHQVNCVVYASSAGACGPATDYPDGICHDNSFHVPRSHYGVFKLCNEGNARVYANDHGIPSIGLRPMAVYGVGREIGLTSDPTKAIRATLLGKPFEIGFKGPTNFNYVEDIANLFIRCARTSIKGSQMCSIKGTEATVETFVSVLKDLVGESAKNITIKSDGPVLPFPYRFSARTLETILGPNGDPTTPLKDGIRKTIQQFKSLHNLTSRL